MIVKGNHDGKFFDHMNCVKNKFLREGIYKMMNKNQFNVKFLFAGKL